MWSGFSIWAEQSKGEEGTEGRRLWRWPLVREKEGEGASGPGLVAKVGPAFCGGQDAFSPGYGGRGLLETGHCSQPGRTRAAVRGRSQAVDFEPHTHRAQGHLGGFHRPRHGEDAGLGCSHGSLSRVRGARGPGRCLPGQATLGGLRQQDGGGEAQPSPAQDGPDSTHGRPQDRSWVTLQEKQERAAQLNLPRRKQAQRGEGRPRLQAGLEPRLHSQGALASKRCLGDTRSRRGVRTGQ